MGNACQVEGENRSMDKIRLVLGGEMGSNRSSGSFEAAVPMDKQDEREVKVQNAPWWGSCNSVLFHLATGYVIPGSILDPHILGTLYFYFRLLQANSCQNYGITFSYTRLCFRENKYTNRKLMSVMIQRI